MDTINELKRSKSVLLVDDDEMQVEAVVDVLQSRDYHTLVCNKPHEALKYIKSQEIGIVVTDLKMPTMTGIDLLAQIKTLPFVINVIIYTGYGSFESAKDAVNLGAFAFVEKLCEPKELINSVDKASHDLLYQYNQKLEQINRELEQRVDARTIALQQTNQTLENEIQAKEVVQEELRLYQEILEHMAETVYLIRADDGVIVYTNPRFQKLFGYTPTEIIGQPASILSTYDESQCQKIIQHIIQGLEQHKKWTGEIENRRKDGSILWCRVNISSFEHVEYGMVWVSVNEDITERKLMEEELRVAKEVAEASNQAKSAFLSRMSHELRTPLNAVIGYSEMLGEITEEEGHLEYGNDLARINQAGRYLLTLVNDILDLAKIEQEKVEFHPEKFDLEVVLIDVLKTIEPLVKKQGNRLHYQFGDLGEMVADITRLRQILFNLLSNACKFTQQGTISLMVKKIRFRGGDGFEFQIQDTGIGISVEHVNTLFQPFKQASEEIAHKYGGTGLGLAISHHLCQLMGGRISVDSELDKGSVFTVLLPVSVEFNK